MQEPNKIPIAMAAVGLGEDSSGSDVSASPSDIESSSRTIRQSPASISHILASNPSAKPCLQAESLSAIRKRLAELDAVEDVLVTQRKKLIAKRKRKDERIENRLREEDARITRQREEEDARRLRSRMAKVDRICKRREREDAEYREKEKAHDDEENELRRRLKTLKRGRPADDKLSEPRHGSRVSESMSPPAKKHQPNPAHVQALNSPSHIGPLQPLQPLQQDRQPVPHRYGFQPGWNPSPLTGPYAYRPSETHQPHNQPILQSHYPLPSNLLPNGGLPRFDPPAPPIRHGLSPKATPPPAHHAQSPHHQGQTPLTTSVPLHYDVRPPSVPSNFTTSNTPPLGFPSINQPPTHLIRTPIQPGSNAKPPPQPAAKVEPLALEYVAHNSPAHPTVDSPAASPTALSGKRKASTTHPYSQSEAFANRHHHCERTDELDRGIWMYFGPGGTKEAPTVAGKKEMYLRCSHDGCMRLDWKTVHGLQCHIVKTHGVPKGTIGSLERALEKYGVEVQEVEGHEKKHGPGSAGATVEKVARGRPRNRLSDETVMPSSGPAAGPKVRPAIAPAAKSGFADKGNPSAPSLLFPNLAPKCANGGYVQDDIVYSEEESDDDEPSAEVKQPGTENTPGPAHLKVPESGPPTPPGLKAGGDAGPSQPIPQSTLVQQEPFHTTDTMKPPAPRPTSSTETLTATDSSPTMTENLPPSSTEQSQHPITHTSSMGTETQEIVSKAERVNARLDAADPDFIPTEAESDVASQTQTSLQNQTQTQSKPQDMDTAPCTKTNSSSRPRAGAEKRVPASERWDWAPIEDEEETGVARRKEGGPTTLTKAQQELQGIDGPTVQGDGDEGESRAAGDADNDGMTAGRSPITSRSSARKKTRRRVDV